ncbi:MAG TPA: DsbA family oxidoreductase [Acidimicrobiales bacterium]|nr:DsbA family oxidoreductase [Acidimicrobiales bacterium]
MTTPLAIDVWSDVVCPFCYIGSAQLDRALEGFQHDVAVTYHAFELDPNAPAATDEPLDEVLAQKYQIPAERARAMNARLADQAAQLGLTLSFATVRRANSLDAHRVLDLATSQGHGGAMRERLFRAYFSDGLLISDHDTLNALAAEVGVSGAPELWEGDALVSEVRRDEQEARNLGLNGVPAFVLDRRLLVSGAQGAEAIGQALAQAWESRED